MINRLNNNNGLTLLEVLASIVILSIVVVSFLSLFPQMSLFNEKTKENLDAVTIAKELLVEMKSARYTAIISEPLTNLPDGLTIIENPTEPLTEGEKMIIEGNYRNNDVRIVINPNKTSMENIEGDINYHEMKIDIFKDISSGQPMSTMYGLIGH